MRFSLLLQDVYARKFEGQSVYTQQEARQGCKKRALLRLLKAQLLLQLCLVWPPTQPCCILSQQAAVRPALHCRLPSSKVSRPNPRGMVSAS